MADQELVSFIRTTLTPLLHVGMYNVEDENVRETPDKLSIIAIGLKTDSVVIRAAIDNNLKRTFISATALPTEEIVEASDDEETKGFLKGLKETAVDETKEVVKDAVKQAVRTIGNIIFKLAGDSDISNPLTSIAIKGLKYLKKQYDLNKTETGLMDEIVKAIKAQYNYSDNLPAYEFSSLGPSTISGEWGYWSGLYNPMITAVENSIRHVKKVKYESYRDYDFAQEAAADQKIFDLIVIATDEIGDVGRTSGSGFLAAKTANAIMKKMNKGFAAGELTFVYCHKRAEPMEFTHFAMLSQEIGLYANLMAEQKKGYFSKVKPYLIVISAFGFDPAISAYLQDDKNKENTNIDAIFAIPPVNGSWNNLKIEKYTADEEKTLKKSKPGLFTGAGYVSEELIQKGKRIEKQKQEEKKWSELLQINLAASFLPQSKKDDVLSKIDQESQQATQQDSQQDASPEPEKAQDDEALKALKMRLVKGEITKEEFLELKELL